MAHTEIGTTAWMKQQAKLPNRILTLEFSGCMIENCVKLLIDGKHMLCNLGEMCMVGRLVLLEQLYF